LAYEYSIIIKKTDGTSVALPVELVRTFSSKSIRITPNLARRTIRVTFPLYVARSRAIAFLESKRDWLAAALGQAESVRRIRDGSEIELFGRPYVITHLPGARRGVWLEEGRMFVSGQAEFLARRVKDFIKAEALKHFTLVARLYAQKLGVSIGRVAVKDTTSRWGSCSSEGNLSFSWRLALAPAWVAEYIVVHEVAHRVEMNHSHSFWRVVKDAYSGDVDKATRWLARNGSKLYSIE
jgi:predicted metal-dependent hydrolase